MSKRELNISNLQISRSIKCGRSTLIEVFWRCNELGLNYSQAGCLCLRNVSWC